MLKLPGFERLLYNEGMVNYVELFPAMKEITSPKSSKLACGKDVEVKNVMGSTMIWVAGEKLVTAESLEKRFNTAKLLCYTYILHSTT